MSLTAAEQAVVDHLAAEPGPATWAGPPSPGGWVASIRRGGEAADPATVQFVKSRAFPRCQLHYVQFATLEGHPRHMLVRTWQQADGSWAAEPIGGGGGSGPRRPRPWVNFAAQWGAHQFAAGGQVTGEGAETASLVRLTFADGTALTDHVQNGTVLFYASPGVAFPASVEITTAAGDSLAEYAEFNDLS